MLLRETTAATATRGGRRVGRLAEVACWVVATLAGLAPVYAQQPSSPPVSIESASPFSPSTELAKALDRRGDLTLRGTSLEAAIFTINELWKVNIVAGKVDGQVNGVFKNAPLKEILDTILLGNGYGYRLVGESIVVSEIGDLGQINPYFISTAIQVNNVAPSTLVEAVGLLSTPQGKVRAVDSARTLIVIDFPERVNMIRELTASIDAASGGEPGSLDALGRPKPLEVGYFHTQYVTVADAKKVLATVLSSLGRTESIDGEDRLIVVDFAENLRMARTVLEHIDRPRPQVQITALIYDLSLEDIEQIGFNWAQNVRASSGTSVSAAGGSGGSTSSTGGSVAVNPFSPNASGAAFTFQHLSSNFGLSAVAQAVQDASDSRLLANPNVTVMDNEQANFQAVTQIPYQQITQTGQGGQLSGTAFKDAGIKLDVIPKISTDGTVEMTLRPEFSRLTGFTPGDNQPIIDTRSASTVVRVANGQTLVIGGMRQRSDVGDYSGVPGVKDIRLLGHLFRSRSTNIRESELVVFITPVIVGFSDPLPCREQRVFDTIDCRLGHIPQAEGCPECSAADTLGCEIAGPPCPCHDMSPQQYESVLREVSPYRSLKIEPEVMPAGEPGASKDAKATDPQVSTYNGAANSAICRLPPVQQVNILAEPSDPTWRLRRDYDSRFQSTGGVYARQQRYAERKPEAIEIEHDQIRTAQEKKGFWDKVWRR